MTTARHELYLIIRVCTNSFKTIILNWLYNFTEHLVSYENFSSNPRVSNTLKHSHLLWNVSFCGCWPSHASHQMTSAHLSVPAAVRSWGSSAFSPVRNNLFPADGKYAEAPPTPRESNQSSPATGSASDSPVLITVLCWARVRSDTLILTNVHAFTPGSCSTQTCSSQPEDLGWSVMLELSCSRRRRCFSFTDELLPLIWFLKNATFLFFLSWRWKSLQLC